MQVVNVSAVPHRSPFRYPGGKTWLVPFVRQWLQSLPWKPSMFGEAFAGGAIVGLSALFDELTDFLSIIELDESVASVWQTVLNGKGKQLTEKILGYEMNRRNVQESLAKHPDSLLDKAFVTILRNRTQRGGIMAPGASLMKDGENGRGVLSRWYPQTLAKRISAITERRARIIFIRGDGTSFIAANANRTDMVFFIDPPYTVAGRRLYVHSEIDHEKLFKVTSKVKGDFLMTYDDTAPIRALAKKFKFQVKEVPMKNTHHAVMKELLIGRDLTWLRHPVTHLLFKDC